MVRRMLRDICRDGRTGAGIPLDSSRTGTAIDSFQFEAVVLQFAQRHSSVSKKALGPPKL